MSFVVSHHSRAERPVSRLSSRVVRLVTAAVALACSNDPPHAPTQPVGQVPPPGPSFTISGVVFEHTASGRRPAAGVAINVLSDDAVVTTSDADGRYTASVRGGRVSIAPVETEAYLSPCPSGSIWLSVNPNRTIDVDIVSKAVLSTSGVPDSYPRSALYVSGTIVETTSIGPQPVAGARVTLGEGWYVPYTTTLSDTLGRYMLCTAPPGTGTDQQTPLHVTKDGFLPANRVVLAGWDESGVTVELVRKQ